MAAVRYAARRLGGSLLQRTQAAVLEGRRLVPSRFMRSRQFTKVSSEHAGKIPKKHELSDVEYKLKVQAELSKNLKELEKLQQEEANARPNAIQLRLMSIERAIDGVIGGAAKLGFFEWL
ncbi:hypothetical protein CFC21_009495 [Triticum aestivum]|uniref:Uncharacterized protein n=2 Tax=Triticum aestivum TaxID=4565 RepID=A0A9R1ITK0_WHEAT|nr:uncharacterized protein LOC123149552 isoform X2 [Triticum aestivum]XP_044425193.1 uncharacterized protein LOC123149552 isoform X2 [Triticum aestivum]KAF6992510.1 hypothetical protein CFC21_009495 [Triticum aestivum]